MAKTDKKKKREQRVREQMVKKRARDVALAKEEKVKQRLQHKYRERLVPIKNKMNEDEVMAKLQHNWEILKALEANHKLEQAQREEMNKLLESQGVTELKDKIESLNPKKAKMSGSAEVKFTPFATEEDSEENSEN